MSYHACWAAAGLRVSTSERTHKVESKEKQVLEKSFSQFNMMFAFVLLFASLVVAEAFMSNAFLSSRHSSPFLMRVATRDPDAVDFDAPLERLMAVGDIVRSGESDPLLDHETVVDDDNSVYHNKFGEEVDLDPIHNPTPTKLHSDENTDFDAPMWRLKEVGDIVRSGEAKALDHEVVVDDDNTCYHGKDGSIEECVDFDPMH
jgi:hypothetical protein